MKAEDILSKLTLEEKIALGSGASLWETKDLSKYGLPALFMSDGPHGLRKQNLEESSAINASVPATCFPAECLTSCSWDPDLLAQEGAAIAAEAASYGVGDVLGPGACMKRNPLCGRNFEYFSEDPYLAGKLAAGFIRGMQDENISACLKHFAGNNQELFRFTSIDWMDDRTLREIYLTAFEIAVRESQPNSMMCAYDWVEQTPCASNKHLLTDILRDEWGYKGLVMSDWGAMHNRIQSFKAGMDLAMPGGSGFGEKEAAQAVQDGTLSEEDVDRSALRVIELMLKANWLHEDGAQKPFDKKVDDALCEKIAEQSIVLLQNNSDVLPIKEGQTVALIGDMAENPRFQGAGSSHINPTELSTLKDSLAHVSYSPGYEEDGTTTKELVDAAVAAAKEADVAVIVAGLPGSMESEGFDRANMEMPKGHNELIEAVAKANPNTVVVLMCGAPVETPWAPDVKGILYAGLCGQAGSRAIAKILEGKVNPSGHLTDSWPIKYTDCPSSSFYGGEFRDAEYREGIFMGYRYYDTANVPVRFAFGSGLSYTTFALSHMEVKDDKVSVKVTNTGKMAGADVVQMYVRPPKAALARPAKELKGFAKVWLEPGESKTVTMPLTDRSFAVWSDGWKIQKGDYTIEVGDLTVTIAKDGEDIPAPAWQAGSWYETFSGTPTREDLIKMTGYTLSEHKPVPGEFTMESTIEELAPYSENAQRLVNVFTERWRKEYPEGDVDSNPELKMMLASTLQIPVCCLAASYAGYNELLPEIVREANGEPVDNLEVEIGKAMDA